MSSYRFLFSCSISLLIPIASASSDILSVNNQGAFSAEYHATQIHHSFVVDNSQYLKGHQLGLNLGITKTF